LTWTGDFGQSSAVRGGNMMTKQEYMVAGLLIAVILASM
jgi:hypothetical protein